MEEDMSYVLNKFQDILKDKNIDIDSVLGSSSNESSSNPDTNSFSFDNLDVNTILKFKKIMDKINNTKNPRNTLLYALKPFLGDEKKNKLDQYIKISNILSVIEMLN